MGTSFVEVCALCGFVFGVACRLPPSITILILNGCFCFPIGRYLICQLTNVYKRGISEQSPKGYWKYLLMILELLALFMQLGVLVCTPILLSMEKFYSPSEKSKRYVTATYILIPISLILISIVWSGWIQKIITRPSTKQCTGGHDKKLKTARYKTGKYIRSYSYTYN